MALDILVALALPCTLGTVAGHGDLSVKVEVLSQTEIYPGEPVDVQITSKNESEEPFLGYVAGLPGHPRVEYCQQSSFGTKRLSSGEYQGEAVFMPGRLRPGGEQRWRVRLVTDPQSGSLILDQPGEHVVYLIIHPLLDDPGPGLKSNNVNIRVHPVPEHETGALADYRRLALGRLVQRKWGELAREPSALRNAQQFLTAHPESVYARHVRTALIEGLRIRHNKGDATAMEKEALQQLEAANPVW